MLGLDVSYAQGTVDWHEVAKSGTVHFAYAKATEGVDLIDDQFTRNWKAARAVSVPRGAYHFFHFNSDAVSQAEHFIKTIEPAKGDLLPMVDVETDDGIVDIASKVQSLSRFITHVEKAIGGRRMLIYTSYGFWNDSMGGNIRIPVRSPVFPETSTSIASIATRWRCKR